ncbi:hypothetical protein Gohar_020715 [Gossypium harknessii]|uniref:RNase H type-1 domain-containing protein n=1 Tax=Gossypium harknessii TaxID=34285 RepID=A0A7J9HYH7_9ROSI|nr:hypothetical protein [Gossypium harknessii]
MTIDGYCTRYGVLVETRLHAIHDCPYAIGIWKCLVPRHDWSSCFSYSLEDWVKMNLLKSYKFMGKWLIGFGMIISRSEIFQMEIRALYDGLIVAWQEGFVQIKVESDNIILIDVVSNEYAVDNNLSKVRLIHTMLARSWQVRLHVPREQNNVAYCIAKMLIGYLNVKCYLVEPP